MKLSPLHGLALAAAVLGVASWVMRSPVDRATQRYMFEHNIQGGVVAYGRVGEEPAVLGFGNVAATDRLPIASLTKPITSAAVMELVREGKMSLDEAIIPGHAATIRQALRHTAGFNDSPFGCEAEPRFGAKPGTYSNAGYCWVGLAIERASGGPYERFVQGRIAGGAMSTGAASAYGAAGGWEATATDLYRFAARAPNAEVLADPIVLNNGAHYAQGWVVWPNGFGHVGALSNPEVQTILFHGNDGRVIVAMFNRGTGSPRQILDALLEATN